jgi:hypothetical protein
MSRPMLVDGYEVIYLTSDGRVVHGNCASDEDTQLPYWEGPSHECDCLDQCGRMIHSSYSEVEE